MGTYNGCLLIPLTALQDLSYGAIAMLLVRPSPGFTVGYTNTLPPPIPALSPCAHGHKISHTHTFMRASTHTHTQKVSGPHNSFTHLSCIMEVICSSCSADVCVRFISLASALHLVLLSPSRTFFSRFPRSRRAHQANTFSLSSPLLPSPRLSPGRVLPGDPSLSAC